MKHFVNVPSVDMKFNHVLTSAIVEEKNSAGIITDMMLNYQVVVAAGDNAVVEVGDVVEINPAHFKRERVDAKLDIGSDTYKIISPIEMIDKEYYLYISDRDIKWVYNNPESLEHQFTLSGKEE